MEDDDEPDDDGTTAEEPPPDAEPPRKARQVSGSRTGFSPPTAYSTCGRRVSRGNFEREDE